MGVCMYECMYVYMYVNRLIHIYLMAHLDYYNFPLLEILGTSVKKL